MPVICDICQDEIEESDVSKKCSGCAFQGHEQCVKLVPGYRASSRHWRCLQCSKGANSPSAADTNANPFEGEYAKIAQLRTLHQSINEKIVSVLATELPKALEEFGKDLKATLMNQFTEMNNKLIEQNKKIQAQDKKIDELSKEVQLQKDEMCDLHMRVNDLEQAQLAKNIEIHGVPQSAEENVWNVVHGIAQAIEAEDTLEGAECYRGRKMKNKPNVIVVKFKHRDDKEIWLQGRKKEAFKNYSLPTKYSEKAASATGKKGRKPMPLQMRVFEQITYHTRQLLYETQKTAAEKQFKFVWTKGGKIFVRKDADTQALIKITKWDDITTKLVLNQKISNIPNNKENNAANVGDTRGEGIVSAETESGTP